MNRRESVAIFLAIVATCLSVTLAHGFEVKGLGNPESFIVDKETGNYYISNIKGSALSKNNSGFITMLSPDGKVANMKLVEGGRDGTILNAPRGILIVGDILYVADSHHVRSFDKLTGLKKDDIDLLPLKAKHLNGLAAGPDGRIYVTETEANLIFAINPEQGNKAEVFASGKGVESPNGITYDAATNRFIVSMGGGMLAAVGMDGKSQRYAKLQVKSPVGVDIDSDGNIYVSSFNRGVIYKISKKLEQTVVAHGLFSPAHISLDKNKKLILVPLFLKHKVYTINY